MTNEATETLDLAAVERDCADRLPELRDQLQRIRPEARVDERVKAEAADLESQIAATEAELTHVSEEKAELDRRERQAREDAGQAAREAAFAEVLELQAQRRKNAQQYDQHALALAKSMTEDDRLMVAIDAACVRARENKRVNLKGAHESALRFAIHQAKTPPGMIDFAGMSLRTPPKPLSENVPPVPGEDGEDLAERARANAPPKPHAEAAESGPAGEEEFEERLPAGMRRVKITRRTATGAEW
jgi:hypothetical protein